MIGRCLVCNVDYSTPDGLDVHAGHGQQDELHTCECCGQFTWTAGRWCAACHMDSGRHMRRPK